MNKADDINSQIAARTQDLESLRTAMVANTQESRWAHRQAVKNTEQDIEDLKESLASEKALEASQFKRDLRADGRKNISTVRAKAAEVVDHYAQFDRLLGDLKTLAGTIVEGHNEIGRCASQVVTLDPVSFNEFSRREEIADVTELSQGHTLVIAASIASAVRLLLNALPCGRLVQSQYLVPEPMASWGTLTAGAAAEKAFAQLLACIGHKCAEPVKS